jgi:hypothetical protein
VGAGMELDSINVSKSPFCRLEALLDFVW